MREIPPTKKWQGPGIVRINLGPEHKMSIKIVDITSNDGERERRKGSL